MSTLVWRFLNIFRVNERVFFFWQIFFKLAQNLLKIFSVDLMAKKTHKRRFDQ